MFIYIEVLYIYIYIYIYITFSQVTFKDFAEIFQNPY